jgi:hypothetical protein
MKIFSKLIDVYKDKILDVRILANGKFSVKME